MPGLDNGTSNRGGGLSSDGLGTNPPLLGSEVYVNASGGAGKEVHDGGAWSDERAG